MLFRSSLERIRIGKLSPRLVYRNDAPVGIEQSDMRGQGVEDGGLLGGLAVTQVVLSLPQQKHPAVTARHRIYLACGQLLQAFFGLVQRLY